MLEGTVKAISGKQIVMETVYGKGDLTIPTADVARDRDRRALPRLPGRRRAGCRARSSASRPTAVTIAEADGAGRDPLRQRAGRAPRRRPGRQLVRAPAGREPVVERLRGSLVRVVRLERAHHRLATGFGVQPRAGPEPHALRRELPAQHDPRRGGRRRTRTSVDESDEGSHGRRAARLPAPRARPHVAALRLRLPRRGARRRRGVRPRAIPKLGAGYKIVDREDVLFSLDAGFAYVYQKYCGGDTESFTGARVRRRVATEAAVPRRHMAHARRLSAVPHELDRGLLSARRDGPAHPDLRTARRSRPR